MWVASVPDEVNRTRSADGMSRLIASAQRTSSAWLAPKWVPFASARCTAAVTLGWLCPSSKPPWPP